jgi:hypothetical protein
VLPPLPVLHLLPHQEPHLLQDPHPLQELLLLPVPHLLPHPELLLLPVPPPLLLPALHLPRDPVPVLKHKL